LGGKKEKNSSNNKKDISHKNNKRNLFNKYPIIGITLLVVVGGIIIGYSYFGTTNSNLIYSSDRSNLLGDWHDIHGVGLFTTKGSSNDEDNSIYLATNNGLYSKHQNSTWVQVGNYKSDITGFVINPKKEGVMYSSGYPPTGGNLGFRISTDSGNTWKTISPVTGKSSIKTVSLLSGINPIAFNSIAISPVNSEILYGSSEDGDILYMTNDEGKTWSAKTAIPSKIKIKSIVASPSDPNNVFIGTNSGIFYSTDKGNNWTKVKSELMRESTITGLGFNQDNELFAYVIPNTAAGEGNNNQNGYIIESDESGKNWTKTSGQIPNVKAAWKFALGPNGEIYTIVSQQTAQNDIASSVYKSIDNGNTWILEGTNKEDIIRKT
jgi:ligand-binding sensor domain-containing protein